MQKKDLHISFDNLDAIWEKIHGNLKLCLINSIESMNISNEIREENYKRKITGENDEPAVKKSRW